jgi:hypothetical protein
MRSPSKALFGVVLAIVTTILLASTVSPPAQPSDPIEDENSPAYLPDYFIADDVFPSKGRDRKFAWWQRLQSTLKEKATGLNQTVRIHLESVRNSSHDTNWGIGHVKNGVPVNLPWFIVQWMYCEGTRRL